MAESDKNSSEIEELEIALNPIGSLALRERLEKNRDDLISVFTVLAPSTIILTLSPNGFRVIECFLNVNIDQINIPLADSLAAVWKGFEKILITDRGRYICETLLNRGLKMFAHRIIAITPKDWWFRQTGLPSLPVLIKAIDICDLDIANSFFSHDRMEEDLCDSPEGLYCVLKVKKKSMNQPGWKESLEKLILLKVKSLSGCEALAQVIVYGDYLVLGLVAMICRRRESYEDSTTVSLIIRLLEMGSNDLKKRIYYFLGAPSDEPLICQIRSSIRFDDFKRACDSHFTPAQRSRLDVYLTADRNLSKVNECPKMSGPDAPAMNTTTTEGQAKKRKIEPITSFDSTAKKSREETNEVGADTNNGTHSEGRGDHEAATVSVPVRSSANANSGTPGADSTPRLNGSDQGEDVISMAMSDDARRIIVKLEAGDTNSRKIIFASIQTGLLSLMMDERGHEVVKWFIANGSVEQKSIIEQRVMRNVECLVNSGDFGIIIVRTAIDNCTSTDERKERLYEMYENAMRSRANSLSTSSIPGSNNRNTKKQNKQKSTVSKVSNGIYGRGSMRGPSGTRWVSIVKDSAQESNEKTTTADEQTKKRRIEPITSSDSSAKKSREEMKEVEVDAPDDTQATVTVSVRLSADSNNGTPGVESTPRLIVNGSDAGKNVISASMSDMKSRANSSSPSSIPGFNSSNEIEIVTENIKKENQESTLSKVSNGIDGSVSMLGPIGTPWVSIVKDPSQERIDELRDSFNEVVQKLKTNSMMITSKFVNKVAISWIQDDDRRRVFADLVNEHISSMAATWQGVIFLKTLAFKLPFRNILVAPIASILHLLYGSDGMNVLDLMTSKPTLTAFLGCCLDGDDNSHFAKMFHSNMDNTLCVSNAMKLARKNNYRVRNFLTKFGRSIVDTEKGRAFIEAVASPPPVGLNWINLLELLPPPPIHPAPSEVPHSTEDGGETMQKSITEEKMTSEAPPVTSHEDTIATPVETTTALNLSEKNVKDGSSSLASFSFANRNSFGQSVKGLPLSSPAPSFLNANNKTPFRFNQLVDHTKDSALAQSSLSSPIYLFPSRPFTRPPLFISSVIGVSSSGVPSFPIFRPPPPQFSFKRAADQLSFMQPSQPLTLSNIDVENVVKDTVEFIVSTVVETNP